MNEYRALIPIDAMKCPKCPYKTDSVSPNTDLNEPLKCPKCGERLVRDPSQDE